MGQGRLVVALLAALLAALCPALVGDGPCVVHAQTPPSVAGSPENWVHLTNAGGGAYEQRYGQPISISACTLTEGGVSLPQGQSVRVFGRFDPGMMSRRHPEAAPGSTQTAAKPLCETPGQTGLVRTTGGAPCATLVFSICCEGRERQCLPVSPVAEMADALEGTAESYRNQRVVVVGATGGPGPGFQFWDFQVMADFAKREKGGRDSGLRSVVAAAGQAGRQPVRARGQFRGRNLFGDLPPDTRRGSSDWVIADQGVALWVTGRAPKGEGWSLDLDARSESVRWVEVEGEVMARDGVVYLKASRVALVGGPLKAPEAVRP